MKRVGGMRRKTRYKYKKSIKEKGKVPINKFLQKFENGDLVGLKAFSSYQKGFYFRRYHGKIGRISGQQGACYFVDIKLGKNTKRILTHPVHLNKIVYKNE